MDFLIQTAWYSIEIRGTPWRSMELHGLPWKFHGIPKRYFTRVIFNTCNMLRSARNPLECAYGRLKARRQILNKRIDSGLKFIQTLIYASCVLHNICEYIAGHECRG